MAAVASRSGSFRRVLTTTTSSPRRISITLSSSRISPAHSRFVRRELTSLLPVHNAIASACLVSKIPRDVNACGEDRFATYLSPI